MSISDSKDRIDLNQYFQDNFAAKASQHTFKVREAAFNIRGLRLYNPNEKHHRLVYAANSREVFHEKLEKYVPNLQRKLIDDNGVFVYLGFVEGEYLDQHVNGERTNFSFPAERNADGLLDEITLDSIRDAALVCVSQEFAAIHGRTQHTKADNYQ